MTIPPIFPNLFSIYHKFKGILLDAYGVFWGGNAMGLLPGSEEMMKTLIQKGKIVGILSNSTQFSSKEIEKFHAHGLAEGKHFHFLITSGDIARQIFLTETLPFKTPKNSFYLFGSAHPLFSSHEAIFKDTVYKESSSIREADFIYISIPHINGENQTDPELFREKLKEIRSHNLPLVCPNPDQFAHEGNPPRAVVRQGSIAKMYEELGGKVFYIGKPYPKAYSLSFDQFCKYHLDHPKDILMVGDTPETDIRGARQFGMPSALILKTGIMGDKVSRKGLENAVRELLPSDTPDYFLERFAHEFCSPP